MLELRQFDGVFLKPQVALTVTDQDRPTLIRKFARQAKRLDLSLFLEIRIDRFRRFEGDSVLEKIRSFKQIGIPLIATIRSRREGGARNLSDSKRFELFRKILPLVRIIDLELSSARLRKKLVPLAHRKGKRVILSYHNFRSTPPDRTLLGLVQKAKRQGADWVKIAVTARKKSDVARLLLFTHRNKDKDLISIAMGPLGSPTRVLSPLFGSKLTYSFASRAQAPGQLAFPRLCKELKALFRPSR